MGVLTIYMTTDGLNELANPWWTGSEGDAPAWVGVCCGMVFVAAGASMLLRLFNYVRAANTMGAISGLNIMLALGWVVLYKM